MHNYFNYFTEIEEQFQRRRGTLLLLSTLDWALIETWKEAGIPLEAVLRGINSAFDNYDRKPSKTEWSADSRPLDSSMCDDLKEKVSRRLQLEDVERRLTVLEEKLQAALLTSTPEKELLIIRADADRQIAPYRGKMNGPQIDQLHKQFLHKRLLERYGLPRLSLFYM